MFALSFHTDSKKKKTPKKQQKSPTQEWKTTPPNISQAETLSKKPVETGMQGHIRGAKYQTLPTVGQTDKAQLHTGK